MLGFFVQKGEIFTSPKRNDRPTRGSIMMQRYTFTRILQNATANVGWGLIIEDVEVVVHSANVLG